MLDSYISCLKISENEKILLNFADFSSLISADCFFSCSALLFAFCLQAYPFSADLTGISMLDGFHMLCLGTTFRLEVSSLG